jgi:hypothetical protein
MDNHNHDFNTGFIEYKAKVATNGTRDFRSECTELQPTAPRALVMRAEAQRITSPSNVRQTRIIT